jgi:peptidoglycan/LPS O-acetylase OafA/YrhL
MKTPGTTGVLGYRPDIDGLRAIAVFGVIAYHAFPKTLRGGFAGVDIFFAISGYLISGILYKKLLEGRFDFGEFYARRIRRIFPALLIMVILSLAYGRLVLLPDEFQQMGRHIAAGALFIQNFVFWKESGYFDTTADLKPMQHLWSLAVEEQFYIIFPLILILLWKRPRKLLPMMMGMLVISFCCNLVMSIQGRESDFFLTPYRAWEFLGGTILAWWHFNGGHQVGRDWKREAISVVGLLTLLLGFLAVDRSDPYPGWRALFPVCGTLMIIASGKGAWINRNIFSQPWIVWMGLISYPLYLFHWPALSFARIIKGGAVSPATICGALAIALALAVFTYYFVEKPLRFSKTSKIVPCLIIAYLITGGLGFLVWKGYITDSQPEEVKENLKWISDRDYFAGLDSVTEEGGILLTMIGQGIPRTLFLGDSHVQQYIPRLKQIMETDSRFHGDAVVCVTKEGAPVIPGITRDDWPACKSLIPVFLKVLKTHSQISRIVIATQWNRYLFQENQQKYRIDGMAVGSKEGTKYAIKGLKQLVSELVQNGYHVTLMQSPPTDYLLSPKARMKRSFLGVQLDEAKPYPSERYKNQYSQVINAIEKTARESEADLFDPLPYLSTNGNCVNSVDGAAIRFDECHLRPGYVREHADFLDDFIKQ